MRESPAAEAAVSNGSRSSGSARRLRLRTKTRLTALASRFHRVGASPHTQLSHPSRSSSLPNTSSAPSAALPCSRLRSSHSSPLASPPFFRSSLGPGMGENCAGPPSDSRTWSSSGRMRGSASRAKSS